MDVLFLNNSHELKVSGLKDHEARAVPKDSLVEATLLDPTTLEPVPGYEWPVRLFHAHGTRGDYSGKFPGDLEVEENRTYLLKIEAEIEGAKYETHRFVSTRLRYA